MRTIDEVVKEIKSIYPNYVNPIKGDDDNKRLHDRLNEILEIHKAEKRLKGKWIQIDSTKCKCSKCDTITLIAQYPHGDKNFCPNCGADMRESEENKCSG